MRNAVTKWLLVLAVLGLVVLLAPSKASADTVYDITGTLSGYGGPLSFTDSTVDINTSTGLATGASIDIGGHTITGAPTTNTSTEYEWCPYGCSVGFLELTDPSGFQSLGDSGTGTGTVYVFLSAYDSGTVTLTGTPVGSPEPSTLLMLGFGLVGLFATAGLFSKSKLGLSQVA